jgi:hypothetical protein
MNRCHGLDVAHALAVSPGERIVFVTGASGGAGTGLDFVTIAYDAITGTQLWLSRYNGPGNRTDSARSVAVSPDGSHAPQQSPPYQPCSTRLRRRARAIGPRPIRTAAHYPGHPAVTTGTEAADRRTRDARHRRRRLREPAKGLAAEEMPRI